MRLCEQIQIKQISSFRSKLCRDKKLEILCYFRFFFRQHGSTREEKRPFKSELGSLKSQHTVCIISVSAPCAEQGTCFLLFKFGNNERVDKQSIKCRIASSLTTNVWACWERAHTHVRTNVQYQTNGKMLYIVRIWFKQSKPRRARSRPRTEGERTGKTREHCYQVSL